MTSHVDAGSGLVRIINLEASNKDITLTDGSNVKLAPFSRKSTAHISEPVLKKLIPDGVKKMATRRWIRIEEVA